jgi:hypothetical protein
VSTVVALDAALPLDNVVVYDAADPQQCLAVSLDAPELFLRHALLVIDRPYWGGALEVIQARGLDPRKRNFKEPFSEKPAPPDVLLAVEQILGEAKALYAYLYPWKSTVQHSSFRPMITGPEPLHYDSYGGSHPLVTAYINVSAKPRTYGISWNFEQLCQHDPEGVRNAFKLRKRPDDDASYPLRRLTEKGLGPLGPKAPRHIVELAPGAIWFFNAKTVSHEVIHGEGTIGIGWEVPDSGAQLQRAIMKAQGLR